MIYLLQKVNYGQNQVCQGIINSILHKVFSFYLKEFIKMELLSLMKIINLKLK